MSEFLRLVEVDQDKAVFEVNINGALEAARHPEWDVNAKLCTITRSEAKMSYDSSLKHQVILHDSAGQKLFVGSTRTAMDEGWKRITDMVYRDAEPLMQHEGLSLNNRSLGGFQSIEAFQYHGGREGDGWGTELYDSRGMCVGTGRVVGENAHEAMEAVCERFGIQLAVDTVSCEEHRKGYNRPIWTARVYDERPPIQQRLERRARELGREEVLVGYTKGDVLDWFEKNPDFEPTEENINLFVDRLYAAFEWNKDNMIDLDAVGDELADRLRGEGELDEDDFER